MSVVEKLYLFWVVVMFELRSRLSRDRVEISRVCFMDRFLIDGSCGVIEWLVGELWGEYRVVVCCL